MGAATARSISSAEENPAFFASALSAPDRAPPDGSEKRTGSSASSDRIVSRKQRYGSAEAISRGKERASAKSARRASNVAIRPPPEKSA